jgi:uncharacterized protein related to proFAR isomerase
MKYIPLINLKKRKIIDSKSKKNVSLSTILDNFKDKYIYILDHDGISRNKPNLCLYQKLSKNHKIWIDAGPQLIGDVVDIIIAGATVITIRKDLWREIYISDIKEYIETKIYTKLQIKNSKSHDFSSIITSDIDGLVILNKREDIEKDFKLEQYIKNICKKQEIYVYESNKNNVNYWNKLGVIGLLIDINKFEDFN